MEFRIVALIATVSFLMVSSAVVAVGGISTRGESILREAPVVASPSLPAGPSAAPSAGVEPAVPPNGVVSVPVGSGPDSVLVDTANDTAFVASQYSNNVTAITLGTNAIVATIPVGSEPVPQGIALDLANATVYVVTAGSDNVSAIFVPFDAVSASIPVGAAPNAILYDSANGDVYVANGGSSDVTVISTVSNMVVGTIPVGSDPDALALDTTNHELFVANAGSDTVSIISGTTNLVLATESVGAAPGAFGAMAFDPANGEVYVANIGSNNVSAIGGQNHTVFAAIGVGNGPTGLVVDPAKNEVFVVNRNSGNVSVISTRALAVVASIPVGGQPSSTGAVAFDSVRGDVYVPNAGSNNVSVISVASNSVVSSISVLGIPDAIALDTASGAAYVADSGAANVTVFTLASVTFVAAGLPAGSSWSVSAGSPPIVTTNTTVRTTGRIPLQELVGPFTFAILPPAGFGITSVTGPRTPTQTSANLTTTPSTLLVTFGPFETLTFTEVGLPASTHWAMTVSSTVLHGGAPSQSRSSTTSTIAFTVVRGGWKFAVTAKPAIYKSTPPRGSVIVPASPVSRTIRFSLLTAVVVFEESGLPTGTHWQVNITGPMNVSMASGGASIRFLLENGTYTFAVENFTGHHPHPAGGTFTVVVPHTALIKQIVYNSGADPIALHPADRAVSLGSAVRETD
jgi:YVTN family beta-propeller protein